MIHNHSPVSAAAVSAPTATAPSTKTKNPDIDAAGLLCLLAILAQESAQSGAPSNQALWTWAVAKLNALNASGSLTGPVATALAAVLPLGSTPGSNNFSSLFNPSTGTSPFLAIMNWLPSASFDPSTATHADLAAFCFIAMFAGTSATFDGQTISPDLLNDIFGGFGNGGSFAGNIIPYLNAYFEKTHALQGTFSNFLQSVADITGEGVYAAYYPSTSGTASAYENYYTLLQDDTAKMPSMPTGHAALAAFTNWLTGDILNYENTISFIPPAPFTPPAKTGDVSSPPPVAADDDGSPTPGGSRRSKKGDPDGLVTPSPTAPLPTPTGASYDPAADVRKHLEELALLA